VTPSPTTNAETDEDSSEGTNSDPVSGLPPDGSVTGDTVKLNFGGDIIFSGRAGELLDKKGYDYSYAALDGLFKQDDLTVVNLETPVTTGGVGAADKQYVFKGPPKALDALKKAGVDISGACVSLPVSLSTVGAGVTSGVAVGEGTGDAVGSGVGATVGVGSRTLLFGEGEAMGCATGGGAEPPWLFSSIK